MLGDGKTILEPKYENIEYMQASKNFIIETNNKMGIISSKNKETIVEPIYDELRLIDNKRNYFLVKKNNLYGIIEVIDNKKNDIVYIENEKIGVDISKYEENGIKNGYILLDRLVPIMQNGKWGFFDLKLKRTSKFRYDSIGSLSTNGNNTYGLLILPEYELIVVQKNRKYAFIDEEGNEDIVPFIFDKMYLRISSGEKKYYMTTSEGSYNIMKSLEKNNINKKTSSELFDKIEKEESNNQSENNTKGNTTRNESINNNTINSTNNINSSSKKSNIV